MKKTIAPVLLAALLLASSAASAMSEQKNNFVSASDPQTFEVEFKQVQAGFGKGGRFQTATDKELARVNELLGTIHGVFAKSPDASALSNEDKTLLVSSRDELNVILNRVDGDRVICRKEFPSGSNIPKKVCTTAAQRASEHQAAETMMQGGVGSTR